MWYVYMLRCADGSLYTGMTNDLGARMSAHVSGKGAKYTASHGVHALCAAWTVGDRSDALRLERRIKSLDKAKKERLAAGAEPADFICECLECTPVGQEELSAPRAVINEK